MIKTKTFIVYEDNVFASIQEYEKFILENQYIEIISVNILEGNHVLLTYKE